MLITGEKVVAQYRNLLDLSLRTMSFSTRLILYSNIIHDGNLVLIERKLPVPYRTSSIIKHRVNCQSESIKYPRSYAAAHARATSALAVRCADSAQAAQRLPRWRARHYTREMRSAGSEATPEWARLRLHLHLFICYVVRQTF